MDDFETVLEVVYPSLLKMAAKRVGWDHAPDVVHNAVLKLLPKRATIYTPEKLLRKAVRECALNWLEKHKGSARRPRREIPVGGWHELDDLENWVPIDRRSEDGG